MQLIYINFVLQLLVDGHPAFQTFYSTPTEIDSQKMIIFP